jgi:hypothetical protein
MDIANAEGPVGHAHRETVYRDLGHEARWHDLELHGIEVEPEAVGELFDLVSVETTLACHVFSPLEWLAG